MLRWHMRWAIPCSGFLPCSSRRQSSHLFAILLPFLRHNGGRSCSLWLIHCGLVPCDWDWNLLVSCDEQPLHDLSCPESELCFEEGILACLRDCYLLHMLLLFFHLVQTEPIFAGTICVGFHSISGDHLSSPVPQLLSCPNLQACVACFPR